MIAAALAALVAATAYSRRTLTLDGALAATAVGTVVFSRGGLRGAVTLLAFFVSSSALSRLREGRGVRRNAWQVSANGGASAASLLLGSWGGFVGGVAAAAADTWATEIGQLYGGRPRLITSWQEVEAGTSGGVTLAGLLASAGGAAVVGLASGSRRALGVAVLTGVFGSVLDSVLGATVQGDEQPMELPRGFLNNDGVNAVATAAAAGLGAWIGL